MYRYVRKHAGYFAKIHTPHDLLDNDPRVEKLAGNLDYHHEADWDNLMGQRCPGEQNKARLISAIMSTKSDLPGHMQRKLFLEALCQELPDIQRYGRGTTQELAEKRSGLDDFRYTIALENSSQQNYFTEKIYDAFLSWTVPIYWGAPNVSDFFPSKSIIAIDISDFEGSVKTVRTAIENPEDYRSRISDLRESRQRVLEQHLIHAFIKRMARRSQRLGPKRFFLLANLDSVVHRLRDLGFMYFSNLKKLWRKGFVG